MRTGSKGEEADRNAEEALGRLAVDRAVGELRRGMPVVLTGPSDETPWMAFNLDSASEGAMAHFRRATDGPAQLVITGRRIAQLGAPNLADAAAVAIELSDALLATFSVLVDPLSPTRLLVPPRTARAVGPDDLVPGLAATLLAKTARLLPTMLLARLSGTPQALPWYRLSVDSIYAVHKAKTGPLTVVSEARLPLADAGDARMLAFRPSDGGGEHLAVVVGAWQPGQPVLTRVHSSCLTGDLLGSLRCDCGDQLRGAIKVLANAGAGALLYLNQEGRGIGIANKLRAYGLQDRGFDTIDANGQLGFEADERDYAVAAVLLRQLGVTAVRLMTNNPAKVEALRGHGIDVVERVPHAFPANHHNRAYLATKAARAGHLF